MAPPRAPEEVLRRVGVAGVTLAVVLGHIEPTRAAILVGALVATALLCGWRFRARAGGITGDFLGATEQLAECNLLLVLADT
ncbi:MAG: adenosylcobinamide-GDP ribazoletransferase [Myxococcota bacterium]